MEKNAFVGSLVQYAGANKDGIRAVTQGLGVLATGGYLMNRVKKKLQNDTRRKALIEDLATTDPMLKDTEKEQLLQYYATIYNIAPTLSLDKNAVREILQGFVRFGRVDVQTLKTLAETEKNIAQSRDKPLSLGSLF